MASGRPDFHPTMLLEGKYGDTLLPILSDATGQLYVVMTGQGGRVVALDENGFISAKIKGLSGADVKDVAVDSDGVILSRIQGQYGGAKVDVAVDADGNLLSIMQGLYGALLKTIAVDANGVMRANLTAQDLSYLRVGSGYGNVAAKDSGTIAVATSTLTEILSIDGPGVVMGGTIHFTTDIDPAYQSFQISIDGSGILQLSVFYVYAQKYIRSPNMPLYLLEYNPAAGVYTVGIGGSLAFSTTFKLYGWQVSGSSKNCKAWVFYSLQP